MTDLLGALTTPCPEFVFSPFTLPCVRWRRPPR
jgi:hypothetical protein